MKFEASNRTAVLATSALLAAALAVPAAARSRVPLAPEHGKPTSSPVPRATAMRAIDPRPPHVDYDDVDGVVWARGSTYKASFGAEGATYIPFLGSNAPRNFPHALSPSAVTRGGAAIEFERAVAGTRLCDRVEIDRGAFVEAYELAPESIEQLFVFESLAGDGDLEISIPVGSEMSPRESALGLEFENEYGRVAYSRAIAIDAAGRRADAETSLVDGSISIRVVDAFLDTAVFPLTIDPLVTSVAVDNSTLSNLEADVAYDDTFARWLVAYEQVFSGNDHDVFTKAISVDGGTFLASGYVDFTASDWRGPRCANNKLGRNWLVVAMVNASSVRGRLISASTHGTDPQFTISDSAGGLTPDVGGDPYPFAFPGSAYLVVYVRPTTDIDWDIVARGVGSSGSMGPVFAIDTSVFFDHQPSVSKSNDQASWRITWLRDNPGINESLWTARLRYDGTVAQPPTFLTGPALIGMPEVSSTSFDLTTGKSRNLIVYQREMSPGDNDIFMMYMEDNTILSITNLGQLENGGASDTSNQLYPSVDTDGAHFLVAYCDQFGTSTTDYDVWCDDVYVTGANTLGLAQNRINLAFSGSPELFPRIASTHDAEDTDPATVRYHFVAWDDNQTSTNGNIEGAVFATVPGGEHHPFCFGDGTGAACPCGNFGATGHGCAHSFSSAGALLAATGVVSPLQDTFRLDATNLPPTGSQVTFFQGASATSGAAFGDGVRCAVGTTVRIATVASSGGSASYGFGVAGSEAISVRGMVPAIGGVRYYQASYRNAIAFCTSATFNVTNGIAASWAP